MASFPADFERMGPRAEVKTFLDIKCLRDSERIYLLQNAEENLQVCLFLNKYSMTKEG